MSLTPIGLILVPCGLLAAIFRPRYLLLLTIFFAPFTATSLLNSGSGENGSGFPPSLFLVILLLGRTVVVGLMRHRSISIKNVPRPFYWMFAFLLTCTVSLFMPLIAAGKIQVFSKGLLDAPIEPLHFKLANIAGVTSIWIWGWFAFFLIRQNKNKRKFDWTVRVWVSSMIFVSAWGILQFCLFYLNIPYPSSIFNNSASPYAMGYDAALNAIRFPRVSSVALEPSVLAITLVGCLPVLASALFLHYRIFNKWMDRIAFALIGTTLILTTSSTGYIGVGILIFVTVIFGIVTHRITIKHLVIGLVLVISASVSYLLLSNVQSIVQEVVLNKADGYSALERITIVLEDMKYFSNYPILGLGWGSAPAHDMIFGILANCGLIGLGAFLGGIISILRSLLPGLPGKALGGMVHGPSFALFLSLVGTMGAYIVSGLPGGPSFWIVIALATVAPSLIAHTKVPFGIRGPN